MVAKLLVWRRPRDNGQDMGHEGALFLADGIGGIYAIDDAYLLWMPLDPFTWIKFMSVSAAKAAAEADWQIRFAEQLA